MIARAIREVVDARLVDGDPLRHAELAADVRAYFRNREFAHANLLSPVFGNKPTSRPGHPALHGAVFLAELLLVDLANAGLSEFFDEKDFLRDAVLRNDALVGEDFQMCLDIDVRSEERRVGKSVTRGGGCMIIKKK